MTRRADTPGRVRGRRWQRIRALVMARDNWTCRYCGAWAEEVDHVQRVEDGGGNGLDNLVAACRTCNAAKELPERMKLAALRFLRAEATETRPVSAKYLPESHGIRAITGDYSRKR